jgi:hypothetical protein
MKKFVAILIAVFSLNTFASNTLIPDQATSPKAKITRIKRSTLKRIVKYRIQHQDENVILVDGSPTYGRNRNYYTWNRLIVNELSDEIKIRLALARMKALKKYQEIWG